MNTLKVRCPHCGGDSVFAPSNPYRPFCCERCKLIDLGAWASETYRVPVQSMEHEDLVNAEDSDEESMNAAPAAETDPSKKI